MALTNRKLVRLEVSALFDGISELQQNLAYPPLALDGASPVLSLHGDGTVPMMVSKNTNQFDHYFIATIYVNREAHGADAAEDLLDTTYTAVLQAIRDNVTGTTFSELVADPGQRSQMTFATIDGIAYRTEEIGIYTRSNPNG